MRVKIDLHVHSVLSACCGRDNTPQNIVNMSELLGISILAVADHNSCLNFPAVEVLSREKGICALPAMEITTAEEIHVLCLFADFESAKTLSDEIALKLPKVPLDTRFYERQCVTDETDNLMETIPNLLNLACHLDLYTLVDRVKALGGIAIPAHVDKPSASLTSVLGCVPDDLPVTCLEITHDCPACFKRELAEKYVLISNSDAHCLEDMCKTEFSLELETPDIEGLFKRLSMPIL